MIVLTFLVGINMIQHGTSWLTKAGLDVMMSRVSRCFMLHKLHNDHVTVKRNRPTFLRMLASWGWTVGLWYLCQVERPDWQIIMLFPILALQKSDLKRYTYVNNYGCPGAYSVFFLGGKILRVQPGRGW